MKNHFNVAIVGAGVVGGLTAYRLSKMEGISVCLIEQGPEPAWETSRANSAIVHAGFDAKPGTLKARLNVEGSKKMQALCEELSVTYRQTGALVTAFKEEELPVLELLKTQGKQNGVPGLTILTQKEVREIEPNINDAVISALYSPTSAIVSPYELAIAACEGALDNGVTGYFQRKVHGIDGTVLKTDQGEIQADFILLCTGVHSDELTEEPFAITPRKGEYLLYDKKDGNLAIHTLFQVPGKMGKGILISPTVHGNLLTGPTAEDIQNKEDTATTREGIKKIRTDTEKLLKKMPSSVITSFAGLRAVGNTGDFILQKSASNPHVFCAAAIESPGLSASPAIADYLIELLKREGLELTKKQSWKKRTPLLSFQELSLEEKKKKIQENPDYGEIICRCEGITKGEITDAIRRHAGARTVDGVKRSVRAGMGRCQGGFCLPKVIGILSEELGIPYDAVRKSSEHSYYFTGRNL